MRPLPPAIAAQIKPVPSDFAPVFEDRGHYVRWSDTLTVNGYGPAEVELGYSKANGKANHSQEQANLRARAWQTMELARLGCLNLMGYCLTSRHKRG